MSQFSRRARWLQKLFPPSVVPTRLDPTQVSDDVSLVQAYDGGGLGELPVFPPERNGHVDVLPLLITQPEIAIRDYVTKIGITTISDMYQMGPDVYARIIALSAQLIAGTTGNQAFLDVRPPTGSGVGNHISLSTSNYSAMPGDRVPLALMNDLIPSGMQLNWTQIGGNATLQFRLTILWVVAPVGAKILVPHSSADLRDRN